MKPHEVDAASPWVWVKRAGSSTSTPNGEGFPMQMIEYIVGGLAVVLTVVLALIAFGPE